MQLLNVDLEGLDYENALVVFEYHCRSNLMFHQNFHNLFENINKIFSFINS